MIDEMVNSGAFWQMSLCEKAAFRFLISRMPDRNIAIEVGTFCGGALRVLDKYFRKVYSLDLDHSHVRQADFTNAEFITGDSYQTLPALIERLDGETINLVLIDGDHSYDAVLHDVDSVLQHRPQGQLLLLMHDSWDTETRLAIDHAAWPACPYVQAVEKDFCVGDLGGDGLVGGLALALLTPQQRPGDLVIRQSHDAMYLFCLDALRRNRH